MNKKRPISAGTIALLLITTLVLLFTGCGKWVSTFDEAWENEETSHYDSPIPVIRYL